MEVMLEDRAAALWEERAMARAEHDALMAECRVLQAALQKLTGAASVVSTGRADSESEDSERNLENLQVQIPDSVGYRVGPLLGVVLSSPARIFAFSVC